MNKADLTRFKDWWNENRSQLSVRINPKDIQDYFLILEKSELLQELQIIVWPDFNDFWNLYDKKVGKKDKIEKKWNGLSQKTKEKIMEYIPNYIISQPNKRFRKNPETFLNNDGWEDELIMPEEKPTNDQKMLNNAKKNLEGWG